MLKKFFTVFLGSMAALWLSIILFAGILFLTLGLWLGTFKTEPVKSHSVLYLDLKGYIADRAQPVTIQDLLMGETGSESAMDEILEAIDRAKDDPRIEGIYIDCNGGSLNMANREELRTALHNFKSSNKWIYAYSDNFSQSDYYTAAVADSVFLNPRGLLTASGLVSQSVFFKNALEKLGVEIQVIKVGTYKSAVEPFTRTNLSEPARMQTQVLLDTIWDGYVRNVIADRGLPADSTAMFRRMAATPMIAYTAQQLVDAHLISATAYRFNVEQKLRSAAGSGDELNLVTPHQYLNASKQLLDAGNNSKKDSGHIAVVYAVGDIVDNGEGGIVGNDLAPMIIKLADEDKVKGLILRINSGGGSAFASEQIWAALEYFKKQNKPFYASMGGTAASGGYYIACGADCIYADAATVTGSIGIFGIIPYAKELLNQKLGIDFDVVETNPNAAFPRIDAPLTGAQHAALQKNIEAGYDLFVNRVATGRKMKESQVREIAEGRVWAGSTAVSIGLVDRLGGLQDAIAAMSAATGVSEENTVNYPIIKPDLLTIAVEAGTSHGNAGDSDNVTNAKAKNSIPSILKSLEHVDALTRQGIATWLRIRSMGHVQAIAPQIEIR